MANFWMLKDFSKRVGLANDFSTKYLKNLTLPLKIYIEIFRPILIKLYMHFYDV
jgi:hypothetical protein